MTDDEVQLVIDLIHARQGERAIAITSAALRADPDDVRANYLTADAYLAINRPGLSVPFALRALGLDRRAETWNECGRAYDALNRWDDAEQCFRQAIALDPESLTYQGNMSTTLTNAGRSREAVEWCDRIIAVAPEHRQALSNRGMARLALGDPAGWADWDWGIGYSPARAERLYGADTVRWKGESGRTVVYQTEQGLGDEIALAAYLPSCLARTRGIIDCEPRLAGLFRRSFPEAHAVHGTRLEDVDWVEDYAPIERAMLGSIPQWCPVYDGAPYLVADPLRRLQWRAALRSLGEETLKVGLAWTGGILETRSLMRRLTVAQLGPILATPGVEWISLEYKPDDDAEAQAAEIHVWPWGTRTRDYDDTAALVAELDLVIAVPTTVVHLAGALGVPCWVLVQDAPAWPFGVEEHGERMSPVLRFGSVTCIRKRGRDWPVVVREVARRLRAHVDNGGGKHAP